NDPSSKQPSKGWRPGRIWWLAFGVLLVWNAWIFFGQSASNSVELTYSAFLDRVRAGNVAAVTFEGQAVSGTFRQPTAAPVASPAPGSSAPPSGGAENAPTYTAFTTVVPPDGDPTLLPLLDSKDVTVSAKAAGGGSFLLQLALSILPVALFLGVIIYSGRQ